MQRALLTLCLLLPANASAEPWDPCATVETFPDRDWRPVAPDAHGWDRAALLEAKSRFEVLQSAATMVVHRGRLIARWGDVGERFTAQSVRKGLLSSLVGTLVDEKRLSTTDNLELLGIDDLEPPLTPLEKTATLRDLLRSSSGVFHSALYEVGGWKKARQALAKDKAANPERYAPGRYWIYNNWDFNALGTIVENTAKRPIGELFQERIARPLGMEDFRPKDVEYTSKDDMTERYFKNVSEHRAYVFNISTRDLARYGVLYLACGEWNGRRILSQDWVRASLDGVDTSKGRSPKSRDTGFGDYGFLWQIDRPGSRRFADLKTREPAYFATGYRGHLLAVFPYLDLVIAHQVGTRGGVGTEAQMKRARHGSPTVTDDELTSLLEAIIRAHPNRERAFAGR